MPLMMKAAIFVETGHIALDEKPIPDVGPLDALIRITTTTICGTDVHILKGEYLLERGLTVGHEPVGVIEKLGCAVVGYQEGQRVIAGAISPSGHSTRPCLAFMRNAAQERRVDTLPLVTHRFDLEDIEGAYDLFAHQRDGVLKVAITP
jgi:threonine dehydrogenase-like Zn-dependent dehydrogenase